MYQEITETIARGDRPARFLVQAAGGTGKSFLIETLYLWCEVRGLRAEASAPTGIAAARIGVPRTPVRAYTTHYLFGLQGDSASHLDLSQPESERVRRLTQTKVLFGDEISMVDDKAWRAERQVLIAIGAFLRAGPAARPATQPPDAEPPADQPTAGRCTYAARRQRKQSSPPAAAKRIKAKWRRTSRSASRP